MGWLLEKARQAIQEQDRKIQEALKMIPEQYHGFITFLGRSVVLANTAARLSPEEEALGIYAAGGRTYIQVKDPYMPADGRIKAFADAHQKDDGTRWKYRVTSNIDEVNELEKAGNRPEYYSMVVRIDSELFGELEGVARIFWDGTGANKTNPVETAYTSALARAIAQAGIGLIGTGIASAEEVEMARRAEGGDAGEPGASGSAPRIEAQAEKPEAAPAPYNRPVNEPAQAPREEPAGQKPEPAPGQGPVPSIQDWDGPYEADLELVSLEERSGPDGSAWLLFTCIDDAGIESQYLLHETPGKKALVEQARNLPFGSRLRLTYRIQKSSRRQYISSLKPVA